MRESREIRAIRRAITLLEADGYKEPALVLLCAGVEFKFLCDERFFTSLTPGELHAHRMKTGHDGAAR
jgi:hypothetical protein